MIRYPMALPSFPFEEIDGILLKFRTILEGGGRLSMGDYVKQFEDEFARYVGATFAVGTNSCSAALEIACRAIGLQAGDEVIVPAETFVATGAMVIRAGGEVVFAEISPDTFCLSADAVEKKISERTKAVIIVHMGGLITPDIDDIRRLCKKKRLFLIEDAAHAPGASWNGKKAGQFGDIACFSFYSSKVMTTGEGGMLVTDYPELYARANSFRNRGLDVTAKEEIYSDFGTNNRMSEFTAILGLSQLKYLDAFIEKRNKIATIYSTALQGLEYSGLVEPFRCPSGARHTYWRYLVKIHKNIDRLLLRKKMAESGIAIDWAYDPPLHLQPVFRKRYGFEAGHLPLTEMAMGHFICLPIHAQLEENDAHIIVQTFKSILLALHA